MQSTGCETRTSEQIVLVQASFGHVQPVADLAAALFYQRLFELEPAAQQLFSGDTHVQGRKPMLGTVVTELHRLPALIQVIRALGARHRSYGVRTEHYASVGAALLWTLEQGPGETWTPELASAWAHTYAVLSAVMNSAAGEPAQHTQLETYQEVHE